MKKNILIFLRILISFTLVVGIFYFFRDKIDEILDLLRNADVLLLCVVFVSGVANALLFGLRLQWILAAQGVRVSLYNAFVVVMSGYFFGNIVPSSFGADLFKGVYLAKGTNKMKEAFSSILIDRVIGLFTLILIAIFAICVRGDLITNINVKRSIFLMAAGALSVCIFFTNKKLGFLAQALVAWVPHQRFKDTLKDFYLAIYAYKDRPNVILGAGMMSVVAQISFYFCIYLIAIAIGIKVSFFLYLMFLPIISLASLAPSLNGLGVRDVMFVYFFSSYSSPEEALAIAILVNALMIFLGIVGGGIFGLTGTLKLTEMGEPSDKTVKVDNGGCG
jgi:uncharacterized protein (TIRG00374 family)